jgi:hypothetical protein
MRDLACTQAVAAQVLVGSRQPAGGSRSMQKPGDTAHSHIMHGRRRAAFVMEILAANLNAIILMHQTRVPSSSNAEAAIRSLLLLPEGSCLHSIMGSSYEQVRVV